MGPARPNQVGFPGFRAMPQKRSSAPTDASAPFTWSCGPTDTPPETHTTSAAASARSSAATVASRSSGTCSTSSTRAPARAACAASAVALESRIWPGPRGRPGGTSSSPVTRTATRGRAPQLTRSRPSEASTATSAGPSSVPAASTSSPLRTSSPARRTFAPAAVSGTCTRPSDSATRSTGITASAPSGIWAPVEMRMASPRPSDREAGRPARDSPTTASSAAGPATTAKPSIADASNGGRSWGLAMSSASTRPSVSDSGTSSGASGRTAASTCSRASAREISSAGMGPATARLGRFRFHRTFPSSARSRMHFARV